MATSVWSCEVSRRNFRWRLANLANSNGRDAVRSLVNIVHQMLRIERFSEVLRGIQSMTREEFKAESHGGAVFTANRPRDLGNYLYSVLYDSLFRVSHAVSPEKVELFRALESQYETLGLHHPPTATSLEMKGDVMEVLLADSRLLSNVRETQIERAQVMEHFQKFDASMNELLHIVTDDNDGPPIFAAFPPPQIFCKLIFAARSGSETSLNELRECVEKQEAWSYRTGTWTVHVHFR